MRIDEIIRSLLEQAQDRESSIDEDDPDCIFRRDAAALREAAQILQRSRDRQTSCEQRESLLAQARVLSMERRAARRRALAAGLSTAVLYTDAR